MRWTEEGYLFWWRVMLTEKVGRADFRVTDPATGRSWDVDTGRYLTAPQQRMMAVQPSMILETAHLIRDDFRRRGVAGARVYADVVVAMNGRPPARLVDPSTNLAAVSDRIGSQSWVIRSPGGERSTASGNDGS